MKTCETCKWFNIKEGLNAGGCSYSEPPWAHEIGLVSARVTRSSRCSKWETKLERRCNNCDYAFKLVGMDYTIDDYECRRNTRSLVTKDCHWCGEFRGKND